MPAQDPVRVVLGGAETRVRMHLRRLLRDATEVRIVGHLRQAQECVQLVQSGQVDVMLLDVAEDPAAGLELLGIGNQLKLRTVVLTKDDAVPDKAALGRAAVLRRPPVLEIEPAGSAFCRALQRMLLGSTPSARQNPAAPAAGAPRSLEPLLTANRPPILLPELIAIGSSTGGPQALPEVLKPLAKRVRQPIVITQHMPAAFTAVLANFLERQTLIPTVQADHGTPLLSGRIHLAPGGRHLLFAREGGQVVCQLDDGPPENFCKPAVDPMLRSITEVYGGRALAVILTGMGQDGLLGCRALRAAGGAVLAQDEATSVVWGMPGAVAQAGLCQAVLPLGRIAEKVIDFAGMGR